MRITIEELHCANKSRCNEAHLLPTTKAKGSHDPKFPSVDDLPFLAWSNLARRSGGGMPDDSPRFIIVGGAAEMAPILFTSFSRISLIVIMYELV